MNTTITEQISNLTYNPTPLADHVSDPENLAYVVGVRATRKAAAALTAPLEASHGELLAALRGMLGAQTNGMQCHYESPPELAARCNCRSCAKKRGFAAIANAEKLNK